MSLLVLSGCGPAYRSAMHGAFEEGQQAVYVGMDKSEFDRAMSKTMDKTHGSHRRSPDVCRRNGMVYEVVYVRTGFAYPYTDGVNTDDEYTPYLFQDDTLIGYGWAAVGGKKTDSATRRRGASVYVEQNNNDGGNAWTPGWCQSKGGDNPGC